MKHKKIFALIIAGVCLLTGCAETPSSVKTNENGVALQEQVKKQGKKSYEDIKQGIPEQMVQTYQNENLTVDINASVNIPDIVPQFGTVKESNVEIETIEKIIASDKTWVESDADDMKVFVTTDGSRSLSCYANGQSGFSATITGGGKEDQMFSFFSEPLNEFHWNEEQNQYVKQCVDFMKTHICVDQLSNYVPRDIILFEDTDGSRYIEAVLALQFDGIEFCNFNGLPGEEEYGAAMGIVQVSGETIGNFGMDKVYEKASAEEAQMLEWPEILQSVKDAVEHSEISFSESTLSIDDVRLEYILSKDLQYEPVWCFYTKYEPYAEKPAFCIGASDGSVKYAM